MVVFRILDLFTAILTLVFISNGALNAQKSACNGVCLGVQRRIKRQATEASL